MKIIDAIKIFPFLLAVIFVVIYSIARIFFTIVITPDYTLVEKGFSWILLLGELFILVHAFGYALNLLKSSFYKELKPRKILDFGAEIPSVAVLVAARHEPYEVLEQTFTALRNLHYANKKIYYLDDSSEEKFKKEARLLAEKFDLVLFERTERHGAKAGIVNDCLKTLTEKYVAVFDADQNPLPDFLLRLVPIMEGDEKLAFIQTPQFYTNILDNRISRGSAYQQAVFYEYICEAKGSTESMMCCGTNVIFRREALLDVGGMDESVVTEDFATSVKLHLSKWKSLYYNHVGTFGMGPETLGAYFKQQSRWAKGTVGVLRKVIAAFFRNPFSMKLAQWWEYFLSSTYYFVGISFSFLMICPIAYLLFNVPSFFMHTEVYLSVFVPYFLLSIGVFYLTHKTRRYRAKDLFLGQTLIYVTFPVLIAATVNGLLGIQGTFGITEKGKGKALSYVTLWPQLLFVMLNFIALVWGINRYYYERDYSILVNIFWVLYHWIVMLGVFYFNVDTSSDTEKKLDEVAA